MFQLVPKDETSFWRLFRHLLLPVAVCTFVITLICGIAALFNKNAVYFGNRPVTGLAGFGLSFLYWPAEILVFTLLVATILFVQRRFKAGKK